MHQHHHHHGDLDGGLEEPIHDSANEALTDALRASFRVLKVIIVIVFIMYLGSGTTILDQNEQAVVFRFGELQDGVRGPGGFCASLPRPFDELVRLPVAQKRTLIVTGQYLDLDEEKEETARDAQRRGALDPKLDGSLMTGDKGLVHGRWVVTYEIDDLRKFVLNVYNAETEVEAVRVIENAVANAAVAVVGRMSAVQATRTAIDRLQPEILLRAQEKLTALDTGIHLVSIDTETIPPVQTRMAFENVTRASNSKRTKREVAQAWRTQLLNQIAGASYVELEEHFAAYNAAKAQSDSAGAQAAMERVEKVILNGSTGYAIEAIREARTFKKQALEDIRADSKEFNEYLPEYERNPQLLFKRLWLDAQTEILTYPTLTKRYLPPGRKQVRLAINPDPEEKAAIEKAQLQKAKKQAGDFTGRALEKAPTTAQLVK